MSKNLNKLVNDLQGDWELIGEFFDNPNEVVSKYNLSQNEKQVILSRNVNDLSKLGINEQLAVGALSGAHSSGCPTGI